MGAGGDTQAGGWRTSATVCGDFTPSFEHVDTIDLEEVHLDLEESHLDVEVWHRSGQVSGAGGRQSAEFVAGEGRGSRGGLVGACDLLIGATRIPITANECNVGGWRVLKAPNEMPSGAVQVFCCLDALLQQPHAPPLTVCKISCFLEGLPFSSYMCTSMYVLCALRSHGYNDMLTSLCLL